MTVAAASEWTPFGLAWGPVEKIPRPSLAFKDSNVTVLSFQRERLPADAPPSTEVILIDVCKSEGLQQISWASKALSTDEAVLMLNRIANVGNQHFGGKASVEGGDISWDNGKTELRSVSESEGVHRILMVSRGPDFDACSIEHDKGTHEALRDRWLKKFELSN